MLIQHALNSFKGVRKGRENVYRNIVFLTLFPIFSVSICAIAGFVAFISSQRLKNVFNIFYSLFSTGQFLVTLFLYQ